jgi:hypothetical protein
VFVLPGESRPVPLFRASAATFAAENVAGTLAGRLAGQYPYVVGHRAADSEVRSWEQSLPVLAADLLDACLRDVEVLVEYQMPLSSKRIDVLLAGVHPRTGQPSYVVIELKQWSQAEALEDADDLVYVDAYGRHPVLHPVEQVRRYCAFLADFTRAFEHDPDALAGAATCTKPPISVLRRCGRCRSRRTDASSRGSVVRSSWRSYSRASRPRAAPRPRIDSSTARPPRAASC